MGLRRFVVFAALGFAAACSSNSGAANDSSANTNDAGAAPKAPSASKKNPTQPGAPNAATTAVKSTIAGFSLNASDAIFTPPGSTGSGDAVTVGSSDSDPSASSGDSPAPARARYAIKITDYGDSCNIVRGKANSSVLNIDVSTTEQSLKAGVYKVGTADADARFDQLDASCNALGNDSAEGGDSHSAKSGTVTITAVTASGIQGSFELTFANGSLTGTFNAASCTPPSGHTQCVK